MNEHEIQRVAMAANALRPDWPTASLVTFIAAKLADRPRRDVAVALTWVACDSATTTPARVLEAGPWWRATNADLDQQRVRYPPKREQECRKHPGEYADSCRVCNRPKVVDEPELADPERSERSRRVADHMTALRQAHRNATKEDA